VEREYIVTLWRHEDLDDFYSDMESESNVLYAPNREVGVVAKRTISRNTHYMLTDDEAQALRADPRVRAVESMEGIEITPASFTASGIYDKSDLSAPNGQLSRNWCLYRSRNTLTDDPSQLTWTSTGTANEELTGSTTYTETGRNVDIVIVDGHIDPSQPEMKVNADGTGASRVVQIDWSDYTATVEADNPSYTGPDYVFTSAYAYAPYTSSTDSTYNGNMNHGAQVACIAAGNRQGFAPSANIYNICPYSSTQVALGNVNSTVFYTLFDYIRAFHAAKPINTETGCKNPTIANCSFVYTQTLFSHLTNWPHYAETPTNTYGDPVDTTYRLTDNEVENARIFPSNRIQTWASGRYLIRTTNPTSVISDVEDCIDEGIHVVVAGGNFNELRRKGSDPTQSEYFFRTGLYGDSLSQHRSFCPEDGILAGTISGIATSTGEEPVSYTSRGPGIDVYAYADGCTAGLNADNFGNFYNITDSRNTSYYMSQFNGTSCAAPQVSGILAGILERHPDYTPAQAKAALLKLAIGEAYDGPGDWPTEDEFASDETPKVAFKHNEIRPESGRIETRNYRAVRGASGSVYPRRSANTYRTRV
jgi:hypothetical protein